MFGFYGAAVLLLLLLMSMGGGWAHPLQHPLRPLFLPFLSLPSRLVLHEFHIFRQQRKHNLHTYVQDVGAMAGARAASRALQRATHTGSPMSRVWFRKNTLQNLANLCV